MSFHHVFSPRFGNPLPPVVISPLSLGDLSALSGTTSDGIEKLQAERLEHQRERMPHLVGEYVIKHLGLENRVGQMEAIIAHLSTVGIENPVFRGHDAVSLVPEGTLFGKEPTPKAEELEKIGFYATQVSLWRENNFGGPLDQKTPFFHMLYHHDNSMTPSRYPSIIAFDRGRLVPSSPADDVTDSDTIHFRPIEPSLIEDTVVAVYYPRAE